MPKIDSAYLADSISKIFGLPVRVYRNGALCFSRFPAPLPCDPMILYQKEILGSMSRSAILPRRSFTTTASSMQAP